MNEKFEEKKGKTQNCEISHIDRLTLEPRIYKGNQNIFILSMCGAQSVQGDLSKTVWHDCFGRAHVYTAVSGGRVCTRPRGRFGQTRVYTAAWTFTGGRVFIRLRRRFTELYDRMQLKARHATKSRGM